ncbi:MAG TPA: TfoX/Sxy family protein [Planctomycetaceae bacterium]
MLTYRTMTYSDPLALRVRHALHATRGIVEKKMFGGLAFLWHGRLLVGVWHDGLIVRLGPERASTALREPDVGKFDITGRPMKGWVLVDAGGLDSEERLAQWIDQALDFVGTLPAK